MNLLKKQSGFALPIVILIVVVVLIVAGGAGYYGYYSYTSYKAYREIKGPEMVKPKQVITEEVCEEITNRFKRGGCYFNLATETKDSSLCEKTTDEAACYQNIAIATKDVRLCEKITESNSKDGCYYFIAIKTKEDGLCEKIINNIQKTACYAIVKKDSSICEEIADSYGKQICYMNFTERTKAEEEKVELKKEESQKKAERAKPEQVIDETANWKIYRNEEYGFEIKYPQEKDWRVMEIKPTDQDWKSEILIASNQHSFALEIFEDKSSLNNYGHLWSFIEKFYGTDRNHLPLDNVETKEFYIDSKPAIEISYTERAEDPRLAVPAIIVITSNKGFLYRISYAVNSYGSQILSTFKFIER